MGMAMPEQAGKRDRDSHLFAAAIEITAADAAKLCTELSDRLAAFQHSEANITHPTGPVVAAPPYSPYFQHLFDQLDRIKLALDTIRRSIDRAEL